MLQITIKIRIRQVTYIEEKIEIPRIPELMSETDQLDPEGRSSIEARAELFEQQPAKRVSKAERKRKKKARRR